MICDDEILPLFRFMLILASRWTTTQKPSAASLQKGFAIKLTLRHYLPFFSNWSKGFDFETSAISNLNLFKSSASLGVVHDRSTASHRGDGGQNPPSIVHHQQPVSRVCEPSETHNTASFGAIVEFICMSMPSLPFNASLPEEPTAALNANPALLITDDTVKKRE